MPPYCGTPESTALQRDTNENMREWPYKNKELVIKALSERADGTYVRASIHVSAQRIGFLITYLPGSDKFSTSLRNCGVSATEFAGDSREVAEDVG
jgi:hypothetical protein